MCQGQPWRVGDMGDQTITDLGGHQAAVQWETPSGSSHQLFCLAKLVGIWIQLAESLNWLLHPPCQLLTLQSWRWPRPHAQREVDLGQSLLLI